MHYHFLQNSRLVHADLHTYPSREKACRYARYDASYMRQEKMERARVTGNPLDGYTFRDRDDGRIRGTSQVVACEGEYCA